MACNERPDTRTTVHQDDEACPVCHRDRTIALSLRDAIKESRQWLETHPPIAGDIPSINGLKQMLTEACDFTWVMLDSTTAGWTAPAYTNFRCLLERTHLASYFVSRGDAGWEYQSMARRQESLSRLVNNIPLTQREWPREYLKGIAYWNRSPDDEKPETMRRHTKYEADIEGMPFPMREWYEICSMYVHPTFGGEQNIGRGLNQSEIDALVFTGHGYFCTISLAARLVDQVVEEALLIDPDPPSDDPDVVDLWNRMIEIRRGGR